MSNETDQKLYSRRDMLRVAGSTAVISSLVSCGLNNVNNRVDSTPTPTPTTLPNTEIPSFEDNQANEVASKKGIKPGSFFLFSQDVLNNLSAFTGEQLYPIYPPLIFEHKKLIYDLSQAFSIPSNIIAIIMSIESAGIRRSESSAGAQGLFQVMPFHFPSAIQNNPQAMQEPYLNGNVGMNYFKKDCITTAKRELSNYPPTHPNVFARALMAYNGGPASAGLPFDSLPDETKMYGDHLIRYIMTAEIAEGLRKLGNNDQSIIRKLSSNEINARAYALMEFHNNSNGNYSYDQYRLALTELSRQIPGINPITKEPTITGQPFINSYREYLANPIFKIPASPGLRIWLSMGGLGLFQGDQKNTDPKYWETISSLK